MGLARGILKVKTTQTIEKTLSFMETAALPLNLLERASSLTAFSLFLSGTAAPPTCGRATSKPQVPPQVPPQVLPQVTPQISSQDPSEELELYAGLSSHSRNLLLDELSIFVRSESSSEDEGLEREEWRGGKPTGTIKRHRGVLSVKHGLQEVGQILIKDYEGLAQAQCVAQELLFSFCRDHGVLVNCYRVRGADSVSYLEVRVKSRVFHCDCALLEVVEQHEWKLHKTHLTVYTKGRVGFQRFVVGADKVQFLDGDKLNFRASNLRVV